MSRPMEERRKYRRIVIDFPIDYKSGKIAQYKSGRNVSLGGLFIETRVVDSAGTPVRLEFHFSHREEILEAEGEVRWARPEKVIGNDGRIYPPGMGIEFVKIGRNVKEKLKQILETGQ